MARGSGSDPQPGEPEEDYPDELWPDEDDEDETGAGAAGPPKRCGLESPRRTPFPTGGVCLRQPDQRQRPRRRRAQACCPAGAGARPGRVEP
jgi:hypothetical protein